ncbi:MAG: hypothetical protein U5K72_06520 [Balneolaceae bacterium]|nr:hypothetical protein [Balneolaceae bacterium]
MKKIIRSNKLLLAISLLFIALFSLNSCDDTLDPVKENDRFIYSIYGYLESSADTQWVRVIHLQEEIDTTGGGIDGTIKMENLENGESSILKDSLFQYSEDVYAYNFWTKQNIEPRGTYRITAERSDGAVSSVTVEIPDTFKDPVYFPPATPGDPGRLVIEEIDNLADASIRFKIRYNVAGFTVNKSIPIIADTISRAAGYYIPIFPNQIALATKDLDTVDIFDCELYVAQAGEDWVDFPNIDRNLIALPEGISNVETGTGYVVGVTSKRIPYPNGSCTDQQD